jgi:hypothetical protein
MAFPLLMLASAAISTVGQIAAGNAAKQASELTAFNTETEAELGKAQAMQMAQARMDEYESASSANLASFAAAGRDIGSDRSVKAFMDKQKEIIGKDIGRMGTQSQMELTKGRQQAAAERTAGRAAKTASLFSAASTAASGLYKYQMAK